MKMSLIRQRETKNVTGDFRGLNSNPLLITPFKTKNIETMKLSKYRIKKMIKHLPANDLLHRALHSLYHNPDEGKLLAKEVLKAGEDAHKKAMISLASMTMYQALKDIETCLDNEFQTKDQLVPQNIVKAYEILGEAIQSAEK